MTPEPNSAELSLDRTKQTNDATRDGGTSLITRFTLLRRDAPFPRIDEGSVGDRVALG